MKKIIWGIFLVLVLVGCSNESKSVESKEGLSEETEASPKIVLSENAFDFLLNKEQTYAYNQADNSLTVEYPVGLPEDTEVSLILTLNHPDSWGDEYKKYSALIESLTSMVDLKVKDGKISYTFGEADFKGFLLPNGMYNALLIIPSDDETNSFLKEQIVDERDFKKQYPDIAQKSNTLEAMDYSFVESIENPDDYSIFVYDSIEMKNLNSMDQVMTAFDNDVPYLDLEKNVENYKGTKTKWIGEVLEIKEEAGDDWGYDTTVLLALNGNANQVLYMNYKSSYGLKDVEKGNTVTVYGEIPGTITKESERSLVNFDALLIEKQ